MKNTFNIFVNQLRRINRFMGSRKQQPFVTDINGGSQRYSFLSAFISEISSNLLNCYTDNYDPYAWALPKEEIRKIDPTTVVRESSASFNYALSSIEPFLPRIENLWQQLADDESRRILIKLLAYRTLGYQKVKLPLNTSNYWNGIKEIEKIADVSRSISYPFREKQLELDFIDLNKIGMPVKIYDTPDSVYTIYILEQYKCVSGQIVVGVEEGDIVIDAGGFWGDTALYFAYHAGRTGKVFSYEFIPGNLEYFQRNLDLNPHLNDRINIIDRAVWSKSKLKLNFLDNGPGSSLELGDIKKENAIETLSIDDLVHSKKLSKLDFIKMDIEGAELQALKGAIKTLKNHRPELAISIYHKPQDFLDIPEFLFSLNLGYRLYIRHFTIHGAETVLFAKVQG